MDEHAVAVISDTHGLVRPAALKALAGAEMIVHAGDVGAPEVLEALGRIAPVAAVRGNTDRGEWAGEILTTRVIEVGGVRLYVLHNVNDLALDPAAAGYCAVISGHSHRPSVSTRDGVLFLNPGSAGPRRFNLPVTVAILYVRERSLQAEIVQLKV